MSVLIKHKNDNKEICSNPFNLFNLRYIIIHSCFNGAKIMIFSEITKF